MQIRYQKRSRQEVSFISGELKFQQNYSVLADKVIGILQQCVGGRCLDVRSVQEGMRQRNVWYRWRKLCVLVVGGDNGAGDRRCPVRERQIEVARVRVIQKVLYAEAVKRVVEEDGYRVSDPERIPVSRQRSRESDGRKMVLQ